MRVFLQALCQHGTIQTMSSAETRSKHLTISITAGTIIKTISILLLFYLLYRVDNILLIILTSIVLAAAIEPGARWFMRYKVPRVPAVLIVYLLVATILGLLLSVFLPPLIDETAKLLNNLPTYFSNISAWNPTQAGNGLVGEISKAFSLQDAINQLKGIAASFQGNAMQILGLVLQVFGGFFSFILIVVLSFYLAVQENGINDFLRLVTPVKHRHHAVDLWHRTQFKIGRWMQGQVLLSVIIATLVYLGLTILNVKYALMLALLAGVFELIPIFGPIISAIPGIALGFANGISFVEPGLTAAVAVALFYTLVQQFESHLIYPLVVRKVVGVPPLIVIIALIVGWDLAGFLGILISVPVAAGVMELAADIQKDRIAEEKNA